MGTLRWAARLSLMVCLLGMLSLQSTQGTLISLTSSFKSLQIPKHLVYSTRNVHYCLKNIQHKHISLDCSPQAPVVKEQLWALPYSPNFDLSELGGMVWGISGYSHHDHCLSLWLQSFFNKFCSIASSIASWELSPFADEIQISISAGSLFMSFIGQGYEKERFVLTIEL